MDKGKGEIGPSQLGCEILVRALEREGVDTIFAYPGGASMEFHQALTRSEQIRTILPRHEQGGAFAAEGYARATGKAGVCMATSGPGATNLVTGIADAFMDSIPLVAITGQVPQAMIGKGVRALAVVTPNNPTGATYPDGLLQELLALCRAHGIWLVVDETYRDFLPLDAGAPHSLFARPGWQENLIGLYSFSKSFCIPGHRVGAVTAGQAVVSQVAKVMDNLQICAPRPPQTALARAIPALADWRRANALEIAARTAALSEVMAGAQGWKVAALGAYFAFVEHPFVEPSSHDAAHRLAREVGVIAIPGAFFGNGLERYLRVAFANADVATIRQLGSRFASCSA